MLIERFRTSERKACALVGLFRTAWRYQPMVRDDEAPFRAEVIRLACTYGRYGYRMIAGLMRKQHFSIFLAEFCCIEVIVYLIHNARQCAYLAWGIKTH